MSIKLWLRAGAVGLISLALSATIAFAQDHGHDHDRDDNDHRWHEADRDDHHRDHDRDEHHHAYANERERGHAYGRERYHDHDREIHEWYRAHYEHLPPGLARHERLSPVLERQIIVDRPVPVSLRARMHPCPHELEVMLPPPPPNFVHVVIGGNLVLYNRANFQIADVFHFDAGF